jgi:integrase
MKPIKVTLRRKPCAKNMESLYLDYYPEIINPDTQRPQRWEFLGIKIHGTDKSESYYYKDSKDRQKAKIVPLFHKTKVDSQGKPIRLKQVLSQMQNNHNKSQLYLAESVVLERQIAVNKGNYSFASKKAYNSDFIAFFKDLADEKKISNSGIWHSACKKLEKYVGITLSGDRVDRVFAEGFYNFLERDDRLKQNTKHSYFLKFKMAVKAAEKKQVVLEGTFESMMDLAMDEEEVNIEFLTLEELTMVKNTPSSNALYKKAALFSACTGLRRSDIIQFSWGQIKNSNEGLYIDMRQQKTAGVESIGLNAMALELLGERVSDEVKPFAALSEIAWARQDKELHQWIKQAGITKKITFHCFRHTFACALLHKEVDIFRVSKLLGHKSVMTTQRTYAKVLTSDKKKAIDTITF